MGGSSQAKKGNQIAQATLAETKRQYAEQQAEKERNKANAKANAGNVRQSANMAYSNNFQTATDFTSGKDGHYSLLTAGGTESVIADLLGGSNSTLGG